MWKYTEVDAYNSISLHDCRTDDVKIEGNDLVINFPDGFWITPVSKYIDHHCPLKTGPSQLRFIGLNSDLDPVDNLFDSIDLFKWVHLFRRTLFCKRIQPKPTDFLSLINNGKYELEFLYEYHAPPSSLYKCCIWKKHYGMEFECQLELTAQSIEYYWNAIRKDREW